MKFNVKVPGDGLARDRIMGLPVDLSIEVVAGRIEVPASNTDDGILVGTVDDLHIPNCGIAGESTSLFVEVKFQTCFRFFSCFDSPTDWGWGAHEIFARWVRCSVIYKLVEILKL